ncbi:VWA domain-containing protein [Lichenihabitans psoromatis]|uniref:VWA domain-containing protein n=1 Tax=Lichenihabitans psoromatis TaxID=2528642 RepID=UPI0010385280|nr:VWA domain-containing protein [Lichenihabitans psoromatis]
MVQRNSPPVSPRSTPSRAEVDAFIDQAAQTPAPYAASSGRGRLIFALDATMSRQPTWDVAIAVQAKMFDTTAALGGLDVQLVYFRGLTECKASRFVSGGAGLAGVMSKIRVEGGNTQIGRVLTHARDEARRGRVAALVYVGDCLEERIDPLCATAGELGLLGIKAFMFHEGNDRAATRGFQEIARLTGGAYATFDASSPKRLAELLSAAAAYAAGGHSGLLAQTRASDGSTAQNLLSQLR